MESIIKKLLLVLAFLSFLSPVFSQDADAVEDEILEVDEPVSENSEIQWQVIEWHGENGQFATSYTVVVQEKVPKTGGWKDARVMRTEDNSNTLRLDPPLRPGKYRYKVAAWNFLGFMEEFSDWCEFEIIRASKPSVSGFDVKVNHSRTIYMEEVNNGIITAKGKNLFLPKEKSDGLVYTDYVMKKVIKRNGKYVAKKNGAVFTPEILEHSKNNREITFQLDLDAVDVGKYAIFARDSSGLESEISSSGILNVKFKKPVDINVSGGYFLPIVLFDDTIQKYHGENKFPKSAVAKVSFIPVKRRIGYFGLQLEAYGTYVACSMKGYDVDGTIASGYLNFVYQYPLRFPIKKRPPQKRHILTFELHGGVGFEYFINYRLHFPHDIDSEPLNSLNITYDAGAGIQFFVTRRIFTEVNLDFCFAKNADMVLGVIRPGILIGWQF